MPTWSWLLVGFVALDLTIVVLVVRAMAGGVFTPLADAFPPKPHGPNADRRARQSFSFGLLNLGFCIRVTLDDTHVHLEPEPWARWMNIRSTSLPRKCLTAAGTRRGRLWSHPIRVASGTRVPQIIRGPRWVWEALRDQTAAAPSKSV